MRRNIFDILEEEMNLEYEIETIVNLFNEARIYGFNINYSIEDYFTMILPFPKDLAMPRTKRSLSRGRKEIYFTASSPKVSPFGSVGVWKTIVLVQREQARLRIDKINSDDIKREI